MVSLITAISEDLTSKILKYAGHLKQLKQTKHSKKVNLVPRSLFLYSIVGQGVAWSSSLRGGGGGWGLLRDRSNWHTLLRYPCQNYAKVRLPYWGLSLSLSVSLSLPRPSRRREEERPCERSWRTSNTSSKLSIPSKQIIQSKQGISNKQSTKRKEK